MVDVVRKEDALLMDTSPHRVYALLMVDALHMEAVFLKVAAPLMVDAVPMEAALLTVAAHLVEVMAVSPITIVDNASTPLTTNNLTLAKVPKSI